MLRARTKANAKFDIPHTVQADTKRIEKNLWIFRIISINYSIIISNMRNSKINKHIYTCTYLPAGFILPFQFSKLQK